MFGWRGERVRVIFEWMVGEEEREILCECRERREGGREGYSIGGEKGRREGGMFSRWREEKEGGSNNILCVG